MFKKILITVCTFFLLISITGCEKKEAPKGPNTGTVAVINMRTALESLGWNNQFKTIKAKIQQEIQTKSKPIKEAYDNLIKEVGKNEPTKAQIETQFKLDNQMRDFQNQYRQTMQQITMETQKPYILNIKEETINQAKLFGFTIVQFYNPQTILSYDQSCDLTQRVVDAIKANKQETQIIDDTQTTPEPKDPPSVVTPIETKPETPAKK